MRLLLLLLLAAACCCCLLKRVAQPWPLKGGVKPRQGKPSSVTITIHPPLMQSKHQVPCKASWLNTSSESSNLLNLRGFGFLQNSPSKTWFVFFFWSGIPGSKRSAYSTNEGPMW